MENTGDCARRSCGWRAAPPRDRRRGKGRAALNLDRDGRALGCDFVRVRTVKVEHNASDRRVGIVQANPDRPQAIQVYRYVLLSGQGNGARQNDNDPIGVDRGLSGRGCRLTEIQLHPDILSLPHDSHFLDLNRSAGLILRSEHRHK
jgi:hypothetical protein